MLLIKNSCGLSTEFYILIINLLLTFTSNKDVTFVVTSSAINATVRHKCAGVESTSRLVEGDIVMADSNVGFVGENSFCCVVISAKMEKLTVIGMVTVWLLGFGSYGCNVT